MLNNHVSRTATITLNGSPDKVLPLFTPHGETLWSAGWQPEYVYPEEDGAQAGSVWKTRHSKDDPETIWITINYDTETHSVSYVNVTPNKKVTWIDIQCDALDAEKTSAQITYTITALGEEGTDYIQQLTQGRYQHWMHHSWEKAINGAIETGLPQLGRPG